MSLLRSGDPESSQDFKQGISRLPSITGLSGRTSPIDMNGSLLSFHVVDEEDVYVLDWTHNCVTSDPSARGDEETVKGVVLCASVLSVGLVHFYAVCCLTYSYSHAGTQLGHNNMDTCPCNQAPHLSPLYSWRWYRSSFPRASSICSAARATATGTGCAHSPAHY